MKYEDRVVCFLDILGFKKIIDETEKSDDKLQKVVRALSILHEYQARTVENAEYLGESKKITQFSDCIVISFLIQEESQLFHTLSEITHVIIELLNHGFLVRGGIAYGKAMHTDKILIGPALIEAYELESKKAISPRVILTDNLIQLLKQSKSDIHTVEEEEQYIKQWLKKDVDGLYFVDYFSVQEELDYPHYYPMYLHEIYLLIARGLKDNNDTGVRKKYLWMQDKYNYLVENIHMSIQGNPLEDLELQEAYINLKIVKQA